MEVPGHTSPILGAKLMNNPKPIAFTRRVSYNMFLMKLQYHAVSGGIVALVLIPVLGVNSAVFWASAVLIDADHYLDYVYRNGFRDFSVKRMFEFHKYLFENGRGQDFLGLNVMHTVEALLLLYAVSELSGWMWLKAVLWGMLFHILTDLIYLYRLGRIFRRALSIIEYIIRWRWMERQGLRPQLPYDSAMKATLLSPESPERGKQS